MASKVIEQPLALLTNPAGQSDLLLSPGRRTTLKPLTAPISVSTSTLGQPVPCNFQLTMAPIHVPSVATHIMVPLPASETDLVHILYIHTMPYIPSAWHEALSVSNLLGSFHNLVHDITYCSPIGNPPPLSRFLPPNLTSENIHPKIIDQELLAVVSEKYMSGPFTIEQAAIIFGGPFCLSPVGPIKKSPGDGIWRMIRHLSSITVMDT